MVWVELTPEQRAYYRMIYEKQVHVLMEGTKSKNVPQLRNLCMVGTVRYCSPNLRRTF